MKNLLQCRRGGQKPAKRVTRRPEEFRRLNTAEEVCCACISSEAHAVSVTFWELSWCLGLTFCDLTAALLCAHLDANAGRTKSGQMSLNASREHGRAAAQTGPIIRQEQGTANVPPRLTLLKRQMASLPPTKGWWVSS